MANPIRSLQVPSAGFQPIDAGLIQDLINQGNFPVSSYNKNTAGAGTAAVGEVTGADYVCLELSNNSAYAYTTRTVAQMVADLGKNFFVGMTFILLLTNTGNNTVTFTAGTGVTITGTATLATNTTRQFQVTCVSATAWTFQSVGVGTIS